MKFVENFTDSKNRPEIKALIGFSMFVLAAIFAMVGGFYILLENKPELLTIVLGVPGLLAGFGTTLAITQAVADSKIDAVNKDG